MAALDVILIDDAREHLNIEGTEHDAELAGHVTAASELVDQMVGPVMVRVVVDRARRGRVLTLDRRPVLELLSVSETHGAHVLDPAGLWVDPVSGAVRAAGGRPLDPGPWDVTYRAGRTTDRAEVPAAIRLACCVIVAHLWQTQRAVTFGPASGPDDFGGVAPAGFAVPHRARDLLAPHRQVVVV